MDNTLITLIELFTYKHWDLLSMNPNTFLELELVHRNEDWNWEYLSNTFPELELVYSNKPWYWEYLSNTFPALELVYSYKPWYWDLDKINKRYINRILNCDNRLYLDIIRVIINYI